MAVVAVPVVDIQPVVGIGIANVRNVRAALVNISPSTAPHCGLIALAAVFHFPADKD